MKLLVAKKVNDDDLMYDQCLKAVRNKNVNFVIKRLRDIEMLFVEIDYEME